jgi:tetratricopeptide (TPR) repeat protein
MIASFRGFFLALLACSWGAGSFAGTTAGPVEDEIAALQQEFDAASFQTTDRGERKASFQALLEHAAGLRARYPARAEAVAWDGIVLSTYAGEVGGMGALKYAKAARDALIEAERLDPAALDGGVYATLGALYSKVPGGLIGFGDDEAAERYFNKALEIDGASIDNNYFYGEFLLEQGKYAQAVDVLRRALAAPAVESRPMFDAARRAEIRSLLETAERKAG